jgi:16S rRNA (guanine527-N7)-methyltransferase
VKHQQISYHHVPRETFDRVDRLIEEKREILEEYQKQLLWWNQKINLVSRDVPRETVWKHIHHSLLITGLDCYQESNVIVDAGSGGGLPGLPLAIVSPSKKFILNDVVTKKILAVKQIARKLNLQNTRYFDRSIEELRINEPFLLITKHAFKVNHLYGMTKEKPWSSIIFYKGVNFEPELQVIDDPLSIISYQLYNDNSDPFYKDKALVVISRK